MQTTVKTDRLVKQNNEYELTTTRDKLFSNQIRNIIMAWWHVDIDSWRYCDINCHCHSVC